MAICSKRRGVLEIKGYDAAKLLQGVLTSDVLKIKDNDLHYSLLLTPQGKALYDFFILKQADNHLLLDYPKAYMQELKVKMNMYKLRANAEITFPEDYSVFISSERTNEHFKPDPRTNVPFFRAILSAEQAGTITQNDNLEFYDMERLKNKVADIEVDWAPGEFFPLELGLEHAISYDKGCYIGQEVIARTTHRGKVRKGVYLVNITDGIPERGENLYYNERKVGKLMGQVKDKALSVLRHEFAEESGVNELKAQSGATFSLIK